jgi:glycerophosphoryl diester phosphodiesterase
MNTVRSRMPPPVMSRRQCLLLGAASALGTGTLPVVQAQTRARIDLQGHRGARGLLPENTLPAFERAMQLGVTTLELDVVPTRDGELVISHDPALNPDITRDAQGRFLSAPGPDIGSLSLAELQTYDVGRLRPGSAYARSFAQQQGLDGVRIPRLADLFEAVRRAGNTQVRFAIETKIRPDRPQQTPDPERFATLLLQTLHAHGMERRAQILSFDWRTLRAVHRMSPGMPTVCITAQLPSLDNLSIRSGAASAWTAGISHAQHGSVPRMVQAAGASHWSSFWRELDEAQVREAHGLGLQVLAWTVNERSAMARMLDMGIDGLVTDRPDIATELLRERGVQWTTGAQP